MPYFIGKFTKNKLLTIKIFAVQIRSSPFFFVYKKILKAEMCERKKIRKEKSEKRLITFGRQGAKG
jgi:hypothetical protein